MGVDEQVAACVCGEINTRHCPVHGQGETTAAKIVPPKRDPRTGEPLTTGTPSAAQGHGGA